MMSGSRCLLASSTAELFDCSSVSCISSVCLTSCLEFASRSSCIASFSRLNLAIWSAAHFASNSIFSLSRIAFSCNISSCGLLVSFSANIFARSSASDVFARSSASDVFARSSTSSGNFSFITSSSCSFWVSSSAKVFVRSSISFLSSIVFSFLKSSFCCFLASSSALQSAAFDCSLSTSF